VRKAYVRTLSHIQFGGQAQVPDVAGTWKDLTDTVNVMAANLTEQVRGIVKVVTAVAVQVGKKNRPISGGATTTDRLTRAGRGGGA
jgi:hypothetical protein